ncbi:MAG: hypothetical protein LBI87_14920 [Candidatus Accumulibacter sp.]|nr:hypothetical protein [Accumulibacter sp.]
MTVFLFVRARESGLTAPSVSRYRANRLLREGGFISARRAWKRRGRAKTFALAVFPQMPAQASPMDFVVHVLQLAVFPQIPAQAGIQDGDWKIGAPSGFRLPSG